MSESLRSYWCLLASHHRQQRTVKICYWLNSIWIYPFPPTSSFFSSRLWSHARTCQYVQVPIELDETGVRGAQGRGEAWLRQSTSTTIHAAKLNQRCDDVMKEIRYACCGGGGRATSSATPSSLPPPSFSSVPSRRHIANSEGAVLSGTTNQPAPGIEVNNKPSMEQ